MSKEVVVKELPLCDFCKDTAHYDGRTVFGSWAYMCEACFFTKGVGLGTGKGQRLIPGDDKLPHPEKERSPDEMISWMCDPDTPAEELEDWLFDQL